MNDTSGNIEAHSIHIFYSYSLCFGSQGLEFVLLYQDIEFVHLYS